MPTLSGWTFKIINIGKPLVKTSTFHQRKAERIANIQAEKEAKRHPPSPRRM